MARATINSLGLFSGVKFPHETSYIMLSSFVYNQSTDLASNQKKSSEETSQRLGSLEDRQENIEKRLEKIEIGGTAKGEHTFRGQHMLLIDKAKYGIKVLGMRETVSELNARTHLTTKLNLTKTTLDNMGISQAYRL